MPPLRPDLAEIRRSVALFMEPGAVVELRVPKAGNDGVISGYFSDPEKLAQAAAAVNGKGPGVYVTLNRIDTNLLARSANRWKPRSNSTTGDDNVQWRRWLLLDFDPRRPTGISSTDAEHDAALQVAHAAKETLDILGWPVPILADSGNGGHLLYPLDLPAGKSDSPEAKASTELIRNTLKSAAKRFGTSDITVDLSVFNASRISKLYGTVAAKGDSTPERPHRLSRIIDLPDTILPVDVSLLKALAAESEALQPGAPQPGASWPDAFPRQPYTGREFDIQGFISRHGIQIERGPVLDNGSEKWVLKNCPFNPDHEAPDAAIFRNPSGALIFKCFHASCADNNWQTLRERFEPGYQQRQNNRVQRVNGHAPAAATGVLYGAVKELAPEPVLEPAGVERLPSVSLSALSDRVEQALVAGIESCYQTDIARLFAVAYLSGGESVIKANSLKADLKTKFKADLNLTRLGDGIRAVRNEIVAESKRNRPEPEAGQIDLLRYNLNDQGNAERILALSGDDMRYCPEFKKWLIWDGKRWTVDGVGRARQLAKSAMREFLRQASDYDEDFAKFASKSLNEKPLSAMLKMLESDLPISSVDLDKNPWWLNCSNGIVDLRTAELSEHLRSEYITKLVHFDYDPTADCPLWLKFLFSAMGGDANSDDTTIIRITRVVSYIQRALGYSLTGVTSEKAVFIPIGEHGNNGKSTMLDTVRRIVREYSALLSVDTLMVRQESNNTQADLADLRGARFVQTSETEESQSLSQGKLKMLTAGMGTIKACRKFENPIEFEASFHIWLDTNKMPFIRDLDDTATLARLHPIPFTIQIAADKIDQSMPDKLLAEGSGILAWMIEGARLWNINRLGKLQEITDARETWRSSQEDPWAQAIEAWVTKKHEEFVRPNTSSPPYFTASIPTILENALAFKVKDMGQHRGESIRVGRILKRAGWIVDKQAGSERIRVYKKRPEDD